MHAPQVSQEAKVRARWLALAVHFDALRMSPRPYLAAFWWRLRGKKLRAKSRLAPLLGNSPKAYKLWLSQTTLRSNERLRPTSSPPIVALVYGPAGEEALTATLLHLAGLGIKPLTVGTAEVPTLKDAAQSIDWSSDPLFIPIASGDRLAPEAVAAYRAALSDANVRLAYADDDLIASDGQRSKPHFKPDWNAELFRHFDYLTGACAFRATREELEAAGADSNWAQSLTNHLSQQAPPLHLHKILHHRKLRPSAKVAPIEGEQPLTWPKVSVIIPTRNRKDLLQACIAGVGITDYPEIEIIIVDNDSDDPPTLEYLASLDPARFTVIRHHGTFNFSAINNRAAMEATGELLCLLNNDVEVVEPKWLKTMVRQAIRPEVGAVGAQLLYPDGRIQHAGVVLGIGGAAAHAHRLLKPDDEGYFRRHALPQFISAVTAACLVVMRDRFLDVGGLDEVHFQVAFNDVDLCMKLNRKGWQTLYEPRATLLHHESVSRGLDRDPAGSARLARELLALKDMWATEHAVDPSHHPDLSRSSEQFVVKL